MPSVEMILTILVSVIAGAALIQLILLLVLAVAVRKGMKAAGEYATELRSDIVPVLEHSKKILSTTRELITRLEPKLESAATDVAELARIANAEAKKLQESADDITGRVRRQAARVDGMATDVLNAVDRAGSLVNQAVSIPFRQVSGVVAAAKAVFDTLRTPAARDGQRGRSRV